MVTEATGFDFFLAHQGVVYGALARLGIHRGRSDFQDWRDEGMLVYLNYFNRYREPLVDETAIAKFNKLDTSLQDSSRSFPTLRYQVSVQSPKSYIHGCQRL